MSEPRPSTFSIVGHDPDAGEWGVAVASKFLAVGAVVPWARAGVGAIATQAYVNTTYGPTGLELMSHGYAAQDSLDGLLAADQGRAHRQAGFVDAHGRSATFTGDECYSWAGGRTGEGYAAQGNILTSSAVVDALAETFESASGPLADRLIMALSAGQDAGGDSRGQQSAALLVVRAGGGYGGFNDRAIDLRVDDHATPIVELERLLQMQRLYFFETRSDDVLVIDKDLARRIQVVLVEAGRRQQEPTGEYDAETRAQLRALFDRENLEGRWREGNDIDRVALTYLEQVFCQK